MKYRNDLLDKNSPAELEVIQITQGNQPASHIYMEAQVSSPDSRFLILHSPAYPHGGKRDDPTHPHRYLLCDTQDDFALSPITEEDGAIAPSISPDGEWLYYFVYEEHSSKQPLLKKVKLDGSCRKEICDIRPALADAQLELQALYPLSTISSDGQRLTIQMCCTREDNTGCGALVVVDLTTGLSHIILHGPTWGNMHAQYSRSQDAHTSHDILIQECHHALPEVAGFDVDLHVIRDDGTNFRDLPLGRDDSETCSGHHCWWGDSDWIISTMSSRDNSVKTLRAALPAPHHGHIGSRTPDAQQFDMAKEFSETPYFIHFGLDRQATRLVTDAGPFDQGGRLFTAELGQPGAGGLTNWRYLLNPGAAFESNSHIHPFLSPDGKTVFFNSDESGTLQAYAIRIG